MKAPKPRRWLYFDASSAREAKQHQSILDRIDAWWTEFRANARRIADHFQQETDWDLPDWMGRTLQAIDPQFMWEFGPAVKGDGHRLVITPEVAKHLRPMTATVLERAPRLKGWEFYAYRLPEDLESAQATVEARTQGDISDVMFSARIGNHHLVDLTFYSPRTQSADDRQALDDAFVATETLLGEERLDKWTGVIEVAPLPTGRKKAALLPLDQLCDRMDALVHQQLDQLPPKAHRQWVENAKWTSYTLEPKEAGDYPDQTDLYVGITGNTSVWTAAHSGASFHSERFSKCNETFCYVKIDGSQGADKMEFTDRAAISDALNDVLRPGRLGTEIGGGTGQRYSYVDLALTDVPQGIAAVQRRLREGRIPKRSWILFFDDYLVAEWVGIYDDTPPPPMRELE